jgi:hypothetical protein
MTNKSFENMDKSFMKDLKNEREKKVPPIYLKGFAQSVERKITAAPEKKRFVVPVWVPVMAVLLIAVTLTVKNPLGARSLSVSPQAVQLASATMSDQELSDEISLMSELGEWTDDDDSLIESLTEEDLEDLEVSYAANQGRSYLA